MKLIKCRAFTLLELTIAMLIAAICVGIAFYVLTTFFNLFSTQQKNKNEDYSFNKFLNRLRIETYKADQLLFADDKLEIHEEVYLTEYHFLDSAIIRVQNSIPTDTLFGKSTIVKSEFKENTALPLLQTLEFALQRNQESFPIILKKQYSAEQLMNIQKQNENGQY
ncbi:type II secretion system protein [Sphingobacterium hotanense]|uniref:type II secretion system protein n=1 Tax=Sphingobacterium hotanense TaxID=649196 RepID=UPI0021A91879|nr:type II secretion system protein [Sphingobacterium hotanense]MCT1526448.1 type II secretion system GspH family protein [Sphingobacterium hotanense]